MLELHSYRMIDCKKKKKNRIYMCIPRILVKNVPNSSWYAVILFLICLSKFMLNMYKCTKSHASWLLINAIIYMYNIIYIFL